MLILKYRVSNNGGKYMMKLSFDTIRLLTFGTEYIEEEDGTVIFSRFTREQRTGLSYGLNNSFSTAGVRIEFETDSRTLKMGVITKQTNEHGRSFYSFDICCNNKVVGQLKNFNDELVYPYKEYHLGHKHETFILPDGLKRVCIYFPWSVQGIIESIYVDDDALIRPIEKKRNLIMYGDSITQGYDSEFPSLSYASKLADALQANGINKGIGGSCYMPELACEQSAFTPELITVAYGTNDWNTSEKDQFEQRCKKFYQNIEINYPDIPIFAISPVWRADCEEQRKFGSFSQIAEMIKKISQKYSNIIFIDGTNFIPKDKKYFRDSYLHPNDEGFDFYAQSVSNEIKKYLG